MEPVQNFAGYGTAIPLLQRLAIHLFITKAIKNMNFYTQLWKQFMRITFLFISILLTIGLISVKADVNGQDLNKQVSFTVGHENLSAAIKRLQAQSGVGFAYDENFLGLAHLFTQPNSFVNESLSAVLTTLLQNSRINFKEEANNILLFRIAYGRITGKVVDETGAPLPGASVALVGTSYGTITDSQGNFVLSVPEGIYTVAISFIGFKKMEFPNTKITSKPTVLNVNMAGAGQLKEVTVTYGKQRQRDITGSLAVVSGTDLLDKPDNQFAQELQGKVAGVEVTQNNGAPGRGFQFKIRGATSFSLSNQPLFVIDGLPITGDINDINPDEIESFTILKDAAATALYGSRASNGVVLITTKHAKPGDAKITFDAYYGVQGIPQQHRYQLMDAEQWAQFENEYYQDKLADEPGTNPTLNAVYADPSRYGVGTNWFDVVTRRAPTESYNLNVSSATDNSQSTVIAGYMNQQGVIVNTGEEQFSLRLNNDYSFDNKKIKIGFNIAPSYHIDHNNRIATEGVNDIIEKVSEASPLISPYAPGGGYTYSAASPGQVANINPLAQLMETIDDYHTTRILGNGYLNYNIWDGLTLKLNAGVDVEDVTHNNFVPSTITTNLIATGSSAYNNGYSYTSEAYLDYNKTIAHDHHIDIIAGYSIQKYTAESNSIAANTFASDAIPYLDQASVVTTGVSDATGYTMLSTIARIDYNYKEKYILQLSARDDGSSRFGTDNKYGFFPTASAGWVASDEDFLKDVKQINFLKIRSSFGLTGNNFFSSNYPSISQIGSGTAYNYTFNNVLQQGEINSTLGNSQLRWERNKQLDIGLDLSILNNRINFTYDYYQKLTDGLIQAMPVPYNSGFTSIVYNTGAIKFWGNEFTLNTTNLTGALKWTSNFNISFNRNLVTSLVSPGYIVRNNTISSDYDRTQVGHPLGMFYGFVFEGLYKDAADVANSPKETLATAAPGTIKFKDVNGDGVINNNDRTFIGNPNPKFEYGFTNNFTYKHFDLNITMSGTYGNQILNADKWAYLTNLDGARGGLLAAVADRWRSEADPGAGIYPRTETGTTSLGRDVESQWVENGSYLAVKNINLGYTLPLKGNTTLRNVRVFVSMDNILFITGYSGLNPEVSLNGLNGYGEGIDENSYPIYRTASVGVSASFK